jgi:hypothetical protein
MPILGVTLNFPVGLQSELSLPILLFLESDCQIDSMETFCVHRIFTFLVDKRFRREFFSWACVARDFGLRQASSASASHQGILCSRLHAGLQEGAPTLFPVACARSCQ